MMTAAKTAVWERRPKTQPSKITSFVISVAKQRCRSALAMQFWNLGGQSKGVIDPDNYDPELNPLFAAMLKHYGVLALPCRPYQPDQKGKVESAVGHTQSTALKGRRFESIQEQNAFLLHWNELWDCKSHGALSDAHLRFSFFLFAFETRCEQPDEKISRDGNRRASISGFGLGSFSVGFGSSNV